MSQQGVAVLGSYCTLAMWARRRIMLQVKPYSLSYQVMSFMKWPFRRCEH